MAGIARVTVADEAFALGLAIQKESLQAI